MKRFAMALLLLSISALASEAEERTWTDSTGKFQVEAELADVQDGAVVLRRSDGRTVRVPLNRLSEKDQQYVAEHQSREPAGAAGELKVTAQAEWGPAFFASEGDDAPEPPLEVAIVVRGKGAAQASAFGDLKLETIKDDQGRELEGKLDSLMGEMMDEEGQMQLIDRTSRFEQHPKDGVRIPIEIENPEPPIDAIKEIRGTVKLRTGGRYENVVVSDIKTQLEKPIADEVLKQAGIAIEVTSQTSDDPTSDDQASDDSRQGDGFTFGLGGEAAETVVVDARGTLEPLVHVELVDGSGKPLEPMMSGSAGFGQQMQYSLGFAEPVPADARLRLVLHVDAQEVVVPFAVKDIDVPPVSEQPERFREFPRP